MNKLLMRMKNIKRVKIYYKKEYIYIESDNIKYANMLNEGFTKFHARVVKLIKTVKTIKPDVNVIVIEG